MYRRKDTTEKTPNWKTNLTNNFEYEHWYLVYLRSNKLSKYNVFPRVEEIHVNFAENIIISFFLSSYHLPTSTQCELDYFLVKRFIPIDVLPQVGIPRY